jgi:hypothetical protein
LIKITFICDEACFWNYVYVSFLKINYNLET